MANFFTSSIGRKFIQSISGAFLILFLALHVTINFFTVIDSAKGEFGAPDGLFQLGCDFMSLPIVKIMVPVLALGFLIHIIYGIYLTVVNLKARGGLKRYESGSKGKADSWSSRNMVVLGLVILGILAFHLTHFWAKMQLLDFMGEEAWNPYLLILKTFQNPVILCIYILWFVAIWLHLNHGFWSMFQTVGWNNQIWLKRLKVIGIVVSTLLCLAFVCVAVNGYIEAHCDTASAQYVKPLLDQIAMLK
ncbi:MAG: succinate dehydrogenase cytochrome b subunit [Bacteroidales bacterium]|nr:succinate dehydrogenase cytochrome b subunit [Bacteroidales bacterium]